MVWHGETLLDCKTPHELRDWFLQNGTTEKSCWVLVSMKPQTDTILYLDAVEQALCFGWIDGIHKKANETQIAQRFTPRKKKGNWTELNKERVRRLDSLGLMTEQGRKCLPDMTEKSFVIHPLILQALKQEPKTYENFLAFPPLYQRVRVDTIQSELAAYNRPELFKKRLEKFIENTRQNKMYGKWNDDGRLLQFYFHMNH
jgi:uncharacterized protein YdeI (YjbR/CyaY-like superfamily)